MNFEINPAGTRNCRCAVIKIPIFAWILLASVKFFHKEIRVESELVRNYYWNVLGNKARGEKGNMQ